MNTTAVLKRGCIGARILSLLTVAALLLSAVPTVFLVAEAANTDAVGSITVFVVPDPNEGEGEYVQITFAGSGTLALDGWTIEDNISQRYTFGASDVLNDGQSITLCGDNTLVSGCDDEYAGGAAVWNNGGDALVLKDEVGTVVLTVSWSTAVKGQVETDSTAVDFTPPAVEVIQGCMDETALNFDPEATESNQEDCVYPEFTPEPELCTAECPDDAVETAKARVKVFKLVSGEDVGPAELNEFSFQIGDYDATAFDEFGIGEMMVSTGTYQVAEVNVPGDYSEVKISCQVHNTEELSEESESETWSNYFTDWETAPTSSEMVLDEGDLGVCLIVNEYVPQTDTVPEPEPEQTPEPLVNTCILPDSFSNSDTFILGDAPEDELSVGELFVDADFGSLDANASQQNIRYWNFASSDVESVTLTMTLLGKQSGNVQTFGYYEAGETDSFVPVFMVGSSSVGVATLEPGESIEVTIPSNAAESLGFALSSEGYPSSDWYSEPSLNPNSEDRVAVYNPFINVYLLAIEDRPNEYPSDNDYNDLVVKISGIRCNVPTTGDNSPDPDETPEEGPEETGGSSSTRSNSSSGTRVVSESPQPQPLVAGVSVDVPSTCPFLLDYMQMGWENDSLEVKKLQLFLDIFRVIYGGTENPVTGEFGAVTDANVKLFQQYYQSDILDPWYVRGIVPHNRPTGFVYKTTLWKINSIVCPDTAILPDFTGENLSSNIDI